MYTTQSGLIIGFHGCDEIVGRAVVTNGGNLTNSDNDYDWLGNGIYFWQSSYKRALRFAEEKQARSPLKIKKPFVIGAILDLGYCLDLLSDEGLGIVSQAFTNLSEILEKSGKTPPVNSYPKGSILEDLLFRKLDCAVIQYLHSTLDSTANKRPYDSIRGLFPEGKELYTGAGFRDKDHIQICIANPNCIKGYFIPRELDLGFSRV